MNPRIRSGTALPYGMRLPLAIAALCLPLAALGDQIYPIDLPSALRLAGAQNLDVQIAQERMNEAKAQYEQAREQFFPWLTPSLGYRHHSGNTQAADGTILDADYQSYTVGGALEAQVDFGSAIYKSLAAEQSAEAAQQQVEASRQDAAFAAAAGYFDLLHAQAAIGVAEQALNISQDYDSQLQRAVEIGLAFKGDAYRTSVQVEQNRLLLRQSQEQRRMAAARLAQTLRLPPATDLLPAESDLAPLTLPAPVAELDALVSQALASRPELKQREAQQRAAQSASDGAKYGPLIPTIGARIGYGGLGGGQDGATGNFDTSTDILFGLSWRIGPGGLFDRARNRAAEAHVQASGLELERARDEVTRQIVDAYTHLHSLSDQLAMAKRSLGTAEQLSRLTHERRDFGVGAVLETLESDQELMRARNDYVGAIAEFNKAQYALRRALGGDSVAANR